MLVWMDRDRSDNRFFGWKKGVRWRGADPELIRSSMRYLSVLGSN